MQLKEFRSFKELDKYLADGKQQPRKQTQIPIDFEQIKEADPSCVTNNWLDWYARPKWIVFDPNHLGWISGFLTKDLKICFPSQPRRFEDENGVAPFLVKAISTGKVTQDAECIPYSCYQTVKISKGKKTTSITRIDAKSDDVTMLSELLNPKSQPARIKDPKTLEMVKDLNSKGVPNQIIADELGVDKSTVSRWVKKLERECV